MSLLVTCPKGHRFPVNLKKHLNRRTRFCPRCKTEVTVRSRFKFLPNPDWAAMKQGYANAAEQKRAQASRMELIASIIGAAHLSIARRRGRR